MHTLPYFSNTHPMITRGKDGIFKPKVFLTKFLETEPSTIQDALSHPLWRQAMADEYQALVQNNTWKVVSKPMDKKVVGCKWVFKIKRNSNGTISHYKAHLVAKGFHQSADLDYPETFSPIVKPTIIRVLLTLGIYYNWTIRQIDISNAFLHGILTDSVYTEQTRGFQVSDSFMVCHLHKTIYGLKQAPRAWYECLSSFLH